MKSQLMLAVGLVACCTLPNLQAQVPNEGLANSIIAARQKNAALMKQYSWSCRMEFLENGTIKDSRVDIVTYGPDGQLQYTSLSNQEAPLPAGSSESASPRRSGRRRRSTSRPCAPFSINTRWPAPEA